MGNDTIVGLGKPVKETVIIGGSRGAGIHRQDQPVEFDEIGIPRFFDCVPILVRMAQQSASPQ